MISAANCLEFVDRSKDMPPHSAQFSLEIMNFRDEREILDSY